MKNERKNISSGAPWEKTVGYSRAVSFGPFLEVSGTTASENGKVLFPGDLFQQTMYILEKIEGVLEKAGFILEDIIRTRVYVTDISRWQEFAEAHSAFFDAIRPTTTLVEVSALIDPEMLIEIEVSAWKEER
jgi:enamine deaminase RidA (YjgF/YER057c/UK114 family)